MSNSRIQIIKDRLSQALSPTHLVVNDESYQHVGHRGAQEGGGHFSVEIAAEIFKGKNKVACHRLIYAALGELMQTDIHALRIQIL